MRCQYCSCVQVRCSTAGPSKKTISECTACGRITSELVSVPLPLFQLQSSLSPLLLSLSSDPPFSISDPSDPFHPSGFITAFSVWSLDPHPVFTASCLSSAGHLAELERVFFDHVAAAGPSVVVDNLRAYLQIIDVASILGLDCDISDHAFQLFRDCSSATCLRNRSVEALATAALVQAIREAQEPRTLQLFRDCSVAICLRNCSVEFLTTEALVQAIREADEPRTSQEISLAANLPQKEIGKYIKILGEALQLSQPINSNSIAVHMPRFCTLLQLNKSAQELATHIGEVVINKCFCTRRNPISISAAAIYLACQLEDKRKTQAEICKITGLTEVTLRKVYKELLENWDDLLPSNYTPAVPPEKAFPTTTIASGRSSSMRGIDILEERERHVEVKPSKPSDCVKVSGERKSGSDEMDVDTQANDIGLEKGDKEHKGAKSFTRPSPMGWQFHPPASAGANSSIPFGQQLKVGGANIGDLNGARNPSENLDANYADIN